MKPSIGRIVHFWFKSRESGKLYARPAIITAVFNENCVNLQVFIDGANDRDVIALGEGGQLTVWRTSVTHSAEPQASTWSWPSREE